MAVLYWSDGGKPGLLDKQGNIFITYTPTQVLDLTYEGMLKKDYLPERRTRQEATFVRHRRPDPVLTLILLFLLLVPGILYLYYAGRAERVAIAAYADSQGVTRIVISPRSGKATPW